MDDKHLPLVVDFLNFRPAKVMRLPRALKRQNPAMINAQIELRTFVILRVNVKHKFITKK